jgi:hypothetical protein
MMNVERLLAILPRMSEEEEADRRAIITMFENPNVADFPNYNEASFGTMLEMLTNHVEYDREVMITYRTWVHKYFTWVGESHSRTVAVENMIRGAHKSVQDWRDTLMNYSLQVIRQHEPGYVDPYESHVYSCLIC